MLITDRLNNVEKNMNQLIYTIILFRLLNLIDTNTMGTIELLVKQISKISQHDSHHNATKIVSNGITIVIEEILRKINKI